MRQLNTFSPTGLTWRRGLQNLLRVVMRDYPSLVEELGRLARRSTLEEFERAFDGTVTEQIKAYKGQHTRFMWEAPEFLADLREALRNV